MRFLPLLLVILTTDCSCWYTADRDDVAAVDAAAPPVTSLAVIPPEIYVTPGAKFVVYARMYDHRKGVLPRHAELQWTAGAGLQERGHAGDSVKIEALPTATSLTSSVTAKIGALTASTTVRVLVSGEQGPPDSVRGDNALWSSPDVALLYDTVASTPVHDSLIAYQQVGLIGNLQGGPGEVARLSATESFQLQPRTWHTGSDVANFASPSTSISVSNSLRQPAFRIWIASTDSRAESLAQVDAAYAATVFIRQRTGLALRPAVSFPNGAGDLELELGPPPTLRCLGLAAKLHDLGIPQNASSFAKESLNVVYVDDIVDPPIGNQAPVSAGLNGYTCPADNTLGSTIFISLHSRGFGTLTHELGHSAGLLEPEWGHTDYQPGFSYTNMMWSYEWDATTAPRSIFSLGQAFRINADDHSWVRWLTGYSRNCDSLAAGRNCPRLEKAVGNSP